MIPSPDNVDASWVFAREALSFLRDSTDCFPLLKSVTGGVLHICTVVEVSRGLYKCELIFTPV